MDDLGQELPPVLSDFTHRAEAGGQTVVYLVRQGRPADAELVPADAMATGPSSTMSMFAAIELAAYLTGLLVG